MSSLFLLESESLELSSYSVVKPLKITTEPVALNRAPPEAMSAWVCSIMAGFI